MRNVRNVNAALAAAVLALMPLATAQAHGRPVSHTVVIHKHVTLAGVYDLRIQLAGRSPLRSAVRVMLGSRTLRGTWNARHRMLRLRVVMQDANRSLTIAATGAKRARVRVSVHRVSPLHTGAGWGQTATRGSHGSTTSTAGPVGSPPITAGTTAGSTLVGSAAPVLTSALPTVLTGSALATAPSSGPVGDPGSWQLAFDDEFTGSSLDSTKWSTGWFGSGITGPVNSNELECYDPNQVAIANGELDLNLIAKSETCAGKTRPYTSGIVTTNGKFSFTHGFIEVRAWLPADTSGAIADWPGIWTDGQSWPTDGELDILEGLSGQACWHFHSPAGGPGGCANGNWTSGWHTFGADWEAGSVTYYYDGNNVGTITTGITSSPMYIILGLGSDPNSTVTAPASQRTDYVRVWRH